MAIKFPLEVKNGVKARTLEELKENFDIEKIVGYFLDGKLLRWLEARYYEDEAEKISQLAKDDTELAKKLSEIFDVKYEQKQVDAEQIMRKKSRLEKLRQFTSDEEIIKNVDLVAFNQEELADLYDLGSTCIYLCEGEFTIPKSKQFIEYISIGFPKTKGLSDKKSNIEQEKQTQSKVNLQEATRKSATEESIIPPEIADIIGFETNYAVTDRYIVFKNTWKNNFSKKAMEEIPKEERYSHEDAFSIWNTQTKQLSSTSFNGIQDCKDYKIMGAYDNVLVLAKFRSYGVWSNYEDGSLICYDIDNAKTYSICMDAISISENTISISDGKLAYKNQKYELVLYFFNTKRSIVIDRELYQYGSNPCAFGKNALWFCKKNENSHYTICKYDLATGSVKKIGKVKDTCKKIIAYKDQIYMLLKKNLGDELELQKYDASSILPETLFIDSKEKSNYIVADRFLAFVHKSGDFPIYLFDFKTETFEMAANHCGFRLGEEHWFKSTEYSYYTNSFNIVGDYLYFEKDEKGKTYRYRFNLITCEIVVSTNL